MAVQEGARSKGMRKTTLASVENRLARLRDLYELGDLTKADYLSGREALQGEPESLAAPAAPSFVRQRTTLRSLCDGWDEMDADERRRILASVFEAITVGSDGVKELTPREGWRPHIRAAVRTARTLPERATLRVHPERKTGRYVPNVETTRLVRDERGWLRLAG